MVANLAPCVLGVSIMCDRINSQTSISPPEIGLIYHKEIHQQDSGEPTAIEARRGNIPDPFPNFDDAVIVFYVIWWHSMGDGELKWCLRLF